MERKAPRKIFAEVPREKLNSKPVSRPVKKVNFDLYENITSRRKISTAEYNNFLRVLKLDLRSGNIEREEYDFYARLANKKHDAHLRKQTVSENPIIDSSASEEAIRKVESAEREEKIKELNEKRLKERELKGEKEESLEEHKKMPFLKRMFTYFKTPGARIFLFIILAAFLMYYLTRSTMNDVIQNPSILIVVVLIIIVILGRGGKTRTYEPSMF